MYENKLKKFTCVKRLCYYIIMLDYMCKNELKL